MCVEHTFDTAIRPHVLSQVSGWLVWNNKSYEVEEEFSVNAEQVDGALCYTKGEGSTARVLYWSTKDREWIIAEEIGGHQIAVAPDGSSFTPPLASCWRVECDTAETEALTVCHEHCTDVEAVFTRRQKKTTTGRPGSTTLKACTNVVSSDAPSIQMAARCAWRPLIGQLAWWTQEVGR